MNTRTDPYSPVNKQTGLPGNDPKAAVDHVYGYEPDGTKIFTPADGNPPFSTTGP